jgi:hypothetical protein
MSETQEIEPSLTHAATSTEQDKEGARYLLTRLSEECVVLILSLLQVILAVHDGSAQVAVDKYVSAGLVSRNILDANSACLHLRLGFQTLPY